MSDSEETTGAVRKTRSGRPVKTPAKTRQKAGPASRKKKKVVVMEVEVSDEEVEQVEGPAEKKAKLDEDKLLEGSDNEATEETVKNEDTLLNSGDESDKRKEKEDVVINDVEMTETSEEVKEENEIKNGKDEEVLIINDDAEVTEESDHQKENGVEEDKEPEKKVKSPRKSPRVKNTEEIKEETKKEITEKHQEEVIDTPQEEATKISQEEVTETPQEITSNQPQEEKLEVIEDSEEDKPEKMEVQEEESKDDKIEEVDDESSKQEESEKEQDNEKEEEPKTEAKAEDKKETPKKVEQNGDPEAENISDEELPGVQVAKVPETEEVSDEELPGPKRAELPADTEVVSEDELPTTKKDAEDEESDKKEDTKRKRSEGDYDPTSPTSETDTPSKKSKDDKEDKDKDEKKPKKLPELDKYWKAVNDDPTDFTGWTYLLQYVDQENDMEAAREAYDAFLSHYPYCYGYWRKYADYEKRKGNKKKCEEVFERGLKAIPLSVDLWIHYLLYVKSTRGEDEDEIRSQFERALTACGLEFRSDRLWDSYIKWETDGKRPQKVTALYDRLLATPTQGYTSHFDNFQEHISTNPPNKCLEVDEFLALRKEVRNSLKKEITEAVVENADVPPGDEDSSLLVSDEETKGIRERIVSIRRKIHKNTVNAVTARWNFEEGIKRPYFHVKPLERCQLKNWQDYLDYEIEQGDRNRIIVLFERCLIACALYEEFWLKFVHYLESLKDSEMTTKIRDVYERACTIHHLKKPNLHLQWAIFEEITGNLTRAAEILVNLEKQVPNVLQVAYRRINLERRRGDHEKCIQLFEHYISNSKSKLICSNVAIKYSRFCLKVLKDFDKAKEALKTAITKEPNNPRLYLQLIDLTLQKDDVKEEEICSIIDEYLEKDGIETEQKILFAQRKLEYLEDFSASIQSVQQANDQYQKYIKARKQDSSKKESKSESSSSSKKDKPSSSSTSSQPNSYSNYNYSGSSSQPPYPYSGSQQGQYNYQQYGQGTSDQYQYQNWQYPQGGYGGYNQWGGYGGGYGY